MLRFEEDEKRKGKGRWGEERECHAYQRRSELNGNLIQAKGTGRDYYRDPINTVHIHLYRFRPWERLKHLHIRIFPRFFALTSTDFTHVRRYRDRF